MPRADARHRLAAVNGFVFQRAPSGNRSHPGRPAYGLAMAVALAFGFLASAFAVPNPVLVPTRGNAADCGVMKFDGEYYIIGNSLAGDMFVSSDLVHWGNRTHVFSMHNDWTPGNTASDRNINACDLSYYNGVFNLYWSVDRADQGVVQIGHAVADHPFGPYREPVTEHWFASKIDAHLYRDDDGSLTFFSVKFDAGNQIWGQPAREASTLAGEPRLLLSATPRSWEQLDDRINEGPFVFKYRGQYYLIYNANHTAKGHYALGCAVAAAPLAFRNAGKYPDPVVEKAFPAPGHRLTSPGQPSVVRGPNGFEWWLVYFLEVDGARRQQAIDRVLFFDQRLYVDGPSSAASPGYHPVPSPPAVLDLFDAAEGSALAGHWQPHSGAWSVKAEAAEQNKPDGRALSLLGGSYRAVHYLVEANVRLKDRAGSEAGVVAYWGDAANWMSVTLDAAYHTLTVRRIERQVEHIDRAPLPTNFNFLAWHSVAAVRNGTEVAIRLDDRPAPGATAAITTGFGGPGVPGLWTDSARADFAGFLYTIGWDETGAAIHNWGPGINGGASRGSWSVTAQGLTQHDAVGQSRIFKGDPAEEYEFSAQLTEDGPPVPDGRPHRMGMLPVYVDDQNYLEAQIDLAQGALSVRGRKAGTPLPVQIAPLPRRFPLPTSEQNGQLWRFASATPGTNWAEVGFNDEGWRTGPGGFGGAAARTAWESHDLWLRREFGLEDTPTGVARLKVCLQGDVEVYLNGVLAVRSSGHIAAYELHEIADAARLTLRKGVNVIAMHASRTSAAQTIDAGLFLAGVVETPGSVNLRAVKLKDRVILFANGQQRLELSGAWPAAQVGLTSDGLACHFNGLTQFRIR